MIKLVVIAVGSDENLAISCLLRVGLSRGDSLLAVYSKSSREPVKKTLASIKDLASKAGASYRELAVSGVNFTSDVKEIVKALVSEPKFKLRIYVCMAGGSWLLTVEVITAISYYTRFMDRLTTIIGVADDGSREVIIPFSFIMPVALTGKDLKVLKVIKSKGITEALSIDLVKTLSQELGISKPGAYKILNRLIKLGVLQVGFERRGRSRVIGPSNAGSIILELL